MLDSFFGVHPYVLRNGLWGKMKPGEKDLYIYLMEESERRCTREIIATDAQIRQMIRTASRTLCNARKKLQEFGLVRCKSGQGNRYKYIICNPKTGQPYSGDPRLSIIVPKRNRATIPTEPGALATPRAAVRESELAATKACPAQGTSLEAHGIPDIF